MEIDDLERALIYYKEELDKAIKADDKKLIKIFTAAVEKLEKRLINKNLRESIKLVQDADTNLLSYILTTCQHCNKNIKESKDAAELSKNLEKKNIFKILFKRFIKDKNNGNRYL